MSVDDNLCKAIEDMVDGNDAGDGDEDLPRIVVSEDSIFVFPSKDEPVDSEDNDWSEKSVYENVSGGRGEFAVDDLVLSEAGLGDVLKRGLFGDVSREDAGKEELGDLEESVGGLEEKGIGGDFYKVSGGNQGLSLGASIRHGPTGPDSLSGPYDEKKYDEKKYDEKSEAAEFYDELINEGKVDGSAETFEEVRRGGRSMLEVAGFRDEEAEKKREEKRRFF
jgi:hypothetical protein